MLRTALARAWALWKGVAHWLAKIQNAVLLVLVYHLGIGPLAVASRLIRRDLLGLRRPPDRRYARPLPPTTRTLDEAKRPF